MAPKPKKKHLDNQPIEGRLDVLAYRLSESIARMVENHIGIGGLWDGVKVDVENLVNENIGCNENLLTQSGFTLLRKLLDAQRVKGRM